MAAIVANTNGWLAIPAPAGLLVLWKQHCFLCAAPPCVMDEWHSDRCVEYRRAQTLEIRSKVLARCEERKDSWAHEVQSQLLVCCDLVAEEALYHRNCHRRFFSSTLCDKAGRPIDQFKDAVFEQLCSWLVDGECELLTLADLTDKAASLSGCGDFFTLING